MKTSRAILSRPARPAVYNAGMKAVEMKRSEQAFRMETRIILIAAIITALLAAIMVRIFVRLAFEVYLLSGFLTFLGIMLLAWIAILIRSKKWDATHFILGEDALLVTRMRGLMGMTTQDVYLYESILSARVQQTYFGQKYGYGDIELTIPKLDRQIILREVVNPDQQLLILKAQMESKGNRSRELVT